MMGERFRKTDSCGTAYTRIYELIEHPLNDSIQASILGGGYPLKIKGGTLVEKNGGVQYTGDDGTTCFFSGVSLGNSALSGTAYQYNGTIHIDEGWANGKDGVQFDINNFIHEYGHFLQEQEMGHFEYSFRVAIPSGTDIGLRNIYNLFGYKHSYSHMDLPFEKMQQKEERSIINGG